MPAANAGVMPSLQPTSSSLRRRRLGLSALALIAGLAACGHGHGPKWPKSAGAIAAADWREDGGQALAPLASTPPLEAATDRGEARDLDRAAEATDAAQTPSDVVEPLPLPSGEQEQLDLGEIELQETIVIEIDD